MNCFAAGVSGRHTAPFAPGSRKLVFAALLALASIPASAQVRVLQPASASVITGTTLNNYNIDNTRNQVGLTSTYISGTTTLSGYTSSGPFHFASDNPNAWIGSGVTGSANQATIQYDLGATAYSVSNLLFWNAGSPVTFRVSTIVLTASDTADFSSGVVNVGTFSPNNSSSSPTPMSNLAFATPVTARYFRLLVTSTSAPNNVGFSEVAFAGTLAPAVSNAPEPGTFALLTLGALGIGGLIARRKP